MYYRDIRFTITIPEPNLSLGFVMKTFNLFQTNIKKLRVKNRNNAWFCAEIVDTSLAIGMLLGAKPV